MTGVFCKGEWHLLTTEHHDPPLGGSHLATSDLPTKTELDHPHWALGSSFAHFCRLPPRCA